MTPEDEKVISEWHGGGASDIHLTCNISNDDRMETFKAFCRKLSQLSSNVIVNFKKSDDKETAPSMEIHKRKGSSTTPFPKDRN